MNNKILAIAVAAIICIGAVGAVMIATGDSDNDITIIDGSGAEISLDAPIDNVVLVNTNIPKALNILGLNVNVKGISLGPPPGGDASWNSMEGWFPNAEYMSTYSSITPEEVKEVADYVICPVKSMTIPVNKQAVFEELGVTIIRLDCNGESMLEDFEKLVKLFGETDGIKTAHADYLDMYNGVIDTVIAKAVDQETVGSDDTFLFMMGRSGGGTFYTQDAELSNVAEAVYGRNVIRDVGLTSSGVTVSASDTNTREKIMDENYENRISKIFIRSTSAYNPSEIWESNNCILSDSDAYGGLTSNLGPDTIYTMHTDLLSGPLGFIGYVLIAEACGISTGLNVTELIEDYNEKYGFNEISTDYLYKIVHDGDSWSAESVVIG